MTMGPPQKPDFTRSISLGNLIQIGIMIFGMGAGWMALDQKIDRTGERVEEVSEDHSDYDRRIRQLENQNARADERFTNILTLLSRIDTRLERIEQRQ